MTKVIVGHLPTDVIIAAHLQGTSSFFQSSSTTCHSSSMANEVSNHFSIPTCSKIVYLALEGCHQCALYLWLSEAFHHEGCQNRSVEKYTSRRKDSSICCLRGHHKLLHISEREREKERERERLAPL